MSSVIPKDHTGMVRHPFKTDCWIPGESSGHANLCMEIPIGEMMECTLGKPDLSALTHNHLTQIQMELWNNRGGGPAGKIINSFYSGATPDQLMSSKEVQDHTDDLIHYLGDAKQASDYIDRELEAYERRVKDSLAERLAEHPYEMPPAKDTMVVFNEVSLDWKTQIYNNVVKRFGGQPAMYLQGITKDTNLPEQAVVEFADVVIKEHDNDPKLAAEVLKTYITEHITMMSSMMMNHALKEKGLMDQVTKVTDNMIEQVNTKGEQNAELQATLEQISQVTIDSTKHKESVPTADQVRDPKKAKRDREGNIIGKKKGKRKSQHIPNVKTASVKRALGASILHMLGTVQRDTQDAQKRALLKEIPAADLIEMASGEKIPDYQANLINSWQAKADPDAPIVKRMTAVEYEAKLDTALAEHITPELFPDDLVETPGLVDEVLAGTKALFMDQFNKGGVSTTPVTVDLVGGSLDGKIYDVSIKAGGADNYFLHYEKFTELAADELKVAIKYIQDRIDAEFWVGLKQTALDFLPVQYAEWKEKFTTDEILELIYKLVVGYTAGYTQAFIHKEHNDRKATEVVQAADLG